MACLCAADDINDAMASFPSRRELVPSLTASCQAQAADQARHPLFFHDTRPAPSAASSYVSASASYTLPPSSAYSGTCRSCVTRVCFCLAARCVGFVNQFLWQVVMFDPDKRRMPTALHSQRGPPPDAPHLNAIFSVIGTPTKAETMTIANSDWRGCDPVFL
jgi:hypothetical protein